MTEERPVLKHAVPILLALWAALFLSGALGELFDIPFLRRMADLKACFLR